MREFHGKIENNFDIEAYLHYYARMKYLFNLSHLDPVEEDKSIVSDALQIVVGLIENGKILENRSNDAVAYFVDTFLSPKGNCCEMDDFIAMKTILEELQQEIEERLADESST